MSFIQTIPIDQAEGDVKAMYLHQQGPYGFVPNYAKVFCHRPMLMAAWAELQRTIRKTMSAQRYELVTLSASLTLKSSGCSLAHGQKLTEQFYRPEQLNAMIQHGQFDDKQDAAIFKFAQQVTESPATIAQNDVDRLKHVGLTDEEIFDIVAAASARCFFARIIDALGALPDSSMLSMESGLQQLLTVGRPISTSQTETISAS